MSDLLSGVERKYDVRITGRIATLLWISSGARPLASEDRYDRMRKSWDEAIRRARIRERIGGPGLLDSSIASFHGALVRADLFYQPAAKPAAEQVRARLEFELEQLGRVAQRLTLRDLNVLLRKVLRLRADLRRRPRV